MKFLFIFLACFITSVFSQTSLDTSRFLVVIVRDTIKTEKIVNVHDTVVIHDTIKTVVKDTVQIQNTVIKDSIWNFNLPKVQIQLKTN